VTPDPIEPTFLTQWYDIPGISGGLRKQLRADIDGLMDRVNRGAGRAGDLIEVGDGGLLND